MAMTAKPDGPESWGYRPSTNNDFPSPDSFLPFDDQIRRVKPGPLGLEPMGEPTILGISLSDITKMKEMGSKKAFDTLTEEQRSKIIDHCHLHMVDENIPMRDSRWRVFFRSFNEKNYIRNHWLEYLSRAKFELRDQFGILLCTVDSL